MIGGWIFVFGVFVGGVFRGVFKDVLGNFGRGVFVGVLGSFEVLF